MNELNHISEAIITLRKHYYVTDNADLANVKSNILTQITTLSYLEQKIPSEFEIKFNVPYDCRLIRETVADLFSLLSIENYDVDCVQSYPTCSVTFHINS